MIHRLNVILKSITNKNVKHGFIKYLSSLDFEDFEYLLEHYFTAILRLMFRYKNKKANFLSKQWFINKKINSEKRKKRLTRVFKVLYLKYKVRITE